MGKQSGGRRSLRLGPGGCDATPPLPPANAYHFAGAHPLQLTRRWRRAKSVGKTTSTVNDGNGKWKMKQAIEITELGQRVVPMRNLNRTIVAREATSGSGGGHVPELVSHVGLCLLVVEEVHGVLDREELRCSRPYSWVQKTGHLCPGLRIRGDLSPVDPGKSAPPRPA